MAVPAEALLDEQLIERQRKLRFVAAPPQTEGEIARLLREVDAALPEGLRNPPLR